MDMLNKKVTHKRLKSKPSKKNKKKITDEDKEFLKWAKLQDLPCFACGEYGSIELHHVRENSCSSRSHAEIIPLCGEKCHRLGVELSAHGTPRKFRQVFPASVQKEAAKLLYNRYLREKQV